MYEDDDDDACDEDDDDDDVELPLVLLFSFSLFLYSNRLTFFFVGIGSGGGSDGIFTDDDANCGSSETLDDEEASPVLPSSSDMTLHSSIEGVSASDVLSKHPEPVTLGKLSSW